MRLCQIRLRISVVVFRAGHVAYCRLRFNDLRVPSFQLAVLLGGQGEFGLHLPGGIPTSSIGCSARFARGPQMDMQAFHSHLLGLGWIYQLHVGYANLRRVYARQIRVGEHAFDEFVRGCVGGPGGCRDSLRLCGSKPQKLELSREANFS